MSPYVLLTAPDVARLPLGHTYPGIFQEAIAHLLTLHDGRKIAVVVEKGTQLEIRFRGIRDLLYEDFLAEKQRILQFLEDNQGWIPTVKPLEETFLRLPLFVKDQPSIDKIKKLFQGVMSPGSFKVRPRYLERMRCIEEVRDKLPDDFKSAFTMLLDFLNTIPNNGWNLKRYFQLKGIEHDLFNPGIDAEIQKIIFDKLFSDKGQRPDGIFFYKDKTPMIQYLLGICYQKGMTFWAREKKEIPRAAFLSYEKAAMQGLPIAMHQLGKCYRDGIGVEKSLIKAIDWLEKAGKLGVSAAGIVLGDQAKEVGVIAYYTRYVSALEKAGIDVKDLISPVAQLDKIFEKGLSLEKSEPEKALLLFMVAERFDHKEAKPKIEALQSKHGFILAEI